MKRFQLVGLPQDCRASQQGLEGSGCPCAANRNPFFFLNLKISSLISLWGFVSVEYGQRFLEISRRCVESSVSVLCYPGSLNTWLLVDPGVKNPQAKSKSKPRPAPSRTAQLVSLRSGHLVTSKAWLAKRMSFLPVKTVEVCF